MIIQTIGGTGIRISELSSFTVEAVRTGTVIITCKGKNRKVLIIKKLREKLLLYAKRHNITHGQIFLTKSGKPIDRSNIWREMKALCKDTGINPKKVFPHNIRHLFARMFYKIEKDILSKKPRNQHYVVLNKKDYALPKTLLIFQITCTRVF